MGHFNGFSSAFPNVFLRCTNACRSGVWWTGSDGRMSSQHKTASRRRGGPVRHRMWKRGSQKRGRKNNGKTPLRWLSNFAGLAPPREGPAGRNRNSVRTHSACRCPRATDMLLLSVVLLAHPLPACPRGTLVEHRKLFVFPVGVARFGCFPFYPPGHCWHLSAWTKFSLHPSNPPNGLWWQAVHCSGAGCFVVYTRTNTLARHTHIHVPVIRLCLPLDKGEAWTFAKPSLYGASC